MIEFVHAGGWPIVAVLTFGGASVLAALFYLWRPLRERLAIVVGSSIGTLLIGGFGTVVGLQRSVSALGEVPHEGQWIFLLGLQESLNNLVAAFVLVCVATALATAGSYRRARAGRGAESAAASAS